MVSLHAFLNSFRALNRVALFVLPLLAFPSAALSAQAAWTTVGPDGGDARVIAAVPGDPRHLYLGTTNSLIYESTDEGVSWHRMAKLDSSDDLVVDHILVEESNPSLIFAAAWKFDHPEGGLWVSRDAGRTWNEVKGLHGQ